MGANGLGCGTDLPVSRGAHLNLAGGHLDAIPWRAQTPVWGTNPEQSKAPNPCVSLPGLTGVSGTHSLTCCPTGLLAAVLGQGKSGVPGNGDCLCHPKGPCISSLTSLVVGACGCPSGS